MTLLDRVKMLCKNKGISKAQMEKDIEISNGASSKWKNSSPSLEILKKLSNYFDVSVDYLMNGDKEETDNSNCDYIFNDGKENVPIELSKKDERDIAKDLNSIMEKLSNNEYGPAAFDGEEIPEDDRELFAGQLELMLRKLKTINKEKYNPNKNKK